MRIRNTCGKVAYWSSMLVVIDLIWIKFVVSDANIYLFIQNTLTVSFALTTDSQDSGMDLTDGSLILFHETFAYGSRMLSKSRVILWTPTYTSMAGGLMLIIACTEW